MADKQCPACKMMIGKGAKVCPHCRKKFGLTWPAKIFLALLILGFIGYLNGPSTISMTKTSVAPSIEEQTLLEAHNAAVMAIAEKKIFIGMTDEQVRAAWGRPYKINRTTGSWGVNEQWVMHDSINSDYLYFENGILKSIQQSK